MTYSFNAEVAGNYSLRAVMAGEASTSPAVPIAVTDSTGATTNFAMDQSVDWEYDQVGTLMVRCLPLHGIGVSHCIPFPSSPKVQ